MDKLLVSPTGGLLVVSPQAPDSLPDSAALGSTAPRRVAIIIDNTGSGVLDWSAKIALHSPWLSLLDSAGTAPDTLYALANPTGLALNVYRDTVIVSGASGGAQLVPIRFLVYPCHVAPFSLDGAQSDTLNAADCGAPHRPGRYAQVYRFDGTANDSVSVEVSADFDGYVTLDTSLASGTPTLDESGTCIGIAGSPCLPYQLLTRSTTYYVEVTSADSADSGLFTLRVVHPRFPGLPDSLDQRFSDSATAVPVGGTIAQNNLLFRGVLSDPDAWDTLRLQVEVQPVGTNFTGLGVTGPPVTNGQPAWVNVTGLNDNTSYHWRARAVDQTGRSTVSWTSFGGNAETDPDFTVTVPHPPNPCSALGQFQSDSVTTIATGGTVDTDVVVLKCTVTDPDPGDQLRIQVEVQPVGTPFTDSPTDSSTAVASGSVAQAKVQQLPNATSFHWQARVSDQTGRTSTWTSYGGNSEAATDFAVSLPHVPNAPVLSQFQANGTTAIPVGGDATSTSVVLKGVVSDPDVGQTVQLQVEVQPVGTSFQDSPTGQSVFVANGGTAQVSITGLTDSVHYHWQGRAVDNTNRAGAWVGFGSNADSATDFRVAVPPSQLVFTVPPSNDTAGSPLSPPIQVTAEDGLGNRLASYNGNVTIGFSGSSGGATLSGTKTAAAVAGVATFSNLSIDKVGTYRLQATTTSPSLNVTSAQFSIAPGQATQLAFTVDPSSGTAGVPISPAVVVTAQDNFGNTATSFTGGVTVALSPNPSALGGTTTRVASAGQATFSDLTVSTPGSGYHLQASSGNLASATSASFNIAAGPATHLEFAVQPSTVQAGDPITPAIVVRALDAANNVATSFNNNVTMSITNPNGAVLSGTNPVQASGGVATFSNLSIDKTGTGYTLTASAGGLSSVQSGGFDVINSPVSKTNSTISASSPITASNGTSVSTITVTARDGSNNPIQGLTVALTATPTTGNNLTQPSAVTNAQGIATGTLSSTKAESKVVSASIGGITINATATVVVNPATAATLAFTSPPSSTTAGAPLNSGTGVVLTASDQFGNLATGFTGSVNLGLTGGTAGAHLSGTNPKNAVAGVATFTNLSVDSAGTGYMLTATSSLPLVTSQAFDITAGSAARLAFTVQPSTTQAGSSITPAVQVAVQDAVGNTVKTFSGNISLGITLNTGTPGASLSGTNPVSVVNGVATFSNLSINLSGTGYTLTATQTTLGFSRESNAFDITAAPATKLGFVVQPTNVVSGAPINPAVVVAAQDANGNTATTFSGSVTLSFANDPTSGPKATLGGTTTVSVSNGLATFSNLTVDSAANGFTLRATSSPSLTQATSSSFNVTPGSAAQLVFTTQPTSTTAGQIINQGSGGVVVTARDAQGNKATSFTSNVTISIVNNAGPGGQLSGTLTKAASAGVATFSDLSINKNGTNYTLGAAGGGLSQVVSNPFNITVGGPAQLAFFVQPSSTTGGATMSSVQVEIQDAGGNRVTTATNSVTIAIQNNANSGTLSGTKTVSASSGVASFSTLSIDSAGTGYTLQATASGLTSATSNSFNITVGSPAKLGFHVQPSNTPAGASITPAVQVEVQDAGGNRVTSASTSITMGIGTNAGGGTLSGTNPVSAVNGLATFSNLSIDKTGNSYTLTANGGGLPQATSNAFNITIGGASKLAFFVQPSSTTGGATMSSVQVEIQDAGGNRVTSATNSVTIAILNNANNGTLSGTKTVSASSGVASFSTLSIDSAGTGYTLQASATGLGTTPSNTFNIAVGSAAKLGFHVQPSNATGGATITPAVQIEVQDAGGNRVTSASTSISLAFGNNAGSGTLTGGGATSASSGIATFSNLSIDKIGIGYTLVASGGGLTQATSAGFNITVGPAFQLAFGQQPTSTTGGLTISPAVTVRILDAGGNLTGSGANVTLAITSNTGTSGAQLSGGSSVTAAASGGIASFGSLSIDSAGTNYTLTATSGSLNQAVSSGFNIGVGPAAKLAFGQQPTATTAGATITPAVTVRALDAGGNLVTGFTSNVSLAIGTNPAGGTLTGGNPTGAVGGIATFANLSIDTPGVGYTLTASSGSLTGATSASFNIN